MLIEVILAVITFYILWLAFKKPSNIPPGYWGLPFIGYIPLFGDKKIEERLTDLNQMYGNVVSWKLGSKLIVVIFDFKLFKEAFVSQEYMNRADIRIFSVLDTEKTLGIIASNGIQWHNSRRFALRHLRDLGMGKSRFAVSIQNEATELVKALKKQAGKPSILSHSLTVAILNIVWQMVASTRYEMDDKELEEFETLFKTMEDNFVRVAIQDFFPFLEYIIPKFLLNRFTRETTRIELSDILTTFLKKFINEHQKNLDPNYPKDFIDAYLIELEKQKDDPKSTMSIDDLTACIADIFLAGSETTTTTLKWAIYYLSNNPEVQNKLQKEIDEVLPKGTLATLEDKPKLPYTEATIHEILRMSSLAKFVSLHMSDNDTKLGGYSIPKGSFVVGAMYSFHEDPKYYNSPKEFRPERFLDSEGKFVNPKDGFMPFGIGRRQCLGESLARMELLIFLTTLVQSLHFSPPPGKKVDLRPDGNILMNFVRNEEILIKIR